jgi:hypothetical protein
LEKWTLRKRKGIKTATVLFKQKTTQSKQVVKIAKYMHFAFAFPSCLQVGGGRRGRSWDKKDPSVKQSVSLGPANPDFSKSPNLCVSEREEQHTQMFSCIFKSKLSVVGIWPKKI